MEFVATVPSGHHQPGRLEDVEVLRDRLPRRRRPMSGDQSRADLEERLAIPILELIENGPPSRICEGFEHVAHVEDDRQVNTCMSSFRQGGPFSFAAGRTLSRAGWRHTRAWV